MTPAEIAAIEARLAAVTPGPWIAELDVFDSETTAIEATVYNEGVSMLFCAETDCNHDGSENNRADSWARAAKSQPMIDADFIAHAPTDLALLVARVRELEAALATARAVLRDALPLLREGCEDAVYGGFHGGDPREFHPDYECSTEQERANHAAACAAFAEAEARGERPSLDDTHSREYDEAGRLVFHVARNPYGLGTSVYRDEERIAIVERALAALRGEVPDV